LKQRISVWVDHWTWQKFFRIFPTHGARSAFLKDVINRAIAMGEQESIANKIMTRIQDETPREDNR
jgi:hypothetical protein